MNESLLFTGPLGRMRAEDVLQFVAQADLRARVEFETVDRAHGWPLAVDLVVDGGALVGLGPRGRGLRLGDLLVARGATARRDLEAALAGAPAGEGEGDGEGGEAVPPLRVGERLVAAGQVAPATLDEVAWERHARVVWGLLAWDRGTFRVTALEPGAWAGATPLEPPLPVAALLLDGLQRAEAAGVEAGPGGFDLATAGEESDPGPR